MLTANSSRARLQDPGAGAHLAANNKDLVDYAFVRYKLLHNAVLRNVC